MSGEPIDDGGPAFPLTSEWTRHGMTLRDYFAGQALAGALASDAHPDVILATLMETPEAIRQRARVCYQLADAMLAERRKGAATT